MMVRPASTFVGAFWLIEMASAMIWSGPQVTPAGLMAMNGVSPRPTQAPGWDGLPAELRKRAAGQYVYPPPPNWCGFISGDYDNLLSCAAGYTCTFSERLFGCCTNPVEQCGLFTTCIDQIFCDADCPAGTRVLRCTEKSLAWCNTYSFWGGTLNYNCGSMIQSVSVDLLEDFYSALGSTLTNGIGSPSKSIENQLSDDSTTIPGRSTTPTGPRFPGSTSKGSVAFVTSVSHHPVLSGAAIGGIAVGGAIVLVAIVAGIIFACCYRQRRQRRHQQDHQSAAAQAWTPRPPATFDPTQASPQGMVPPEKPHGGFQPPPYVNPVQSPYTDHAGGGGSPSPNQPYDPSPEFTHQASTVSPAVSPNRLHFEDAAAQAPSPETTSGYFTRAPPGGYSELSQGGDIPMQLRAGSPPNQIHSSVHEVPATTPKPEGERWELSGR